MRPGPGLSLDQAPPISVPFRFFAAGFVFAAVSALFALLAPDGAFGNRWTPHTLALTHLFGVGCVASIMMGAMFQILPVVAGATFRSPRAVATWLLALHGIGALGLAFGLFTSRWDIAWIPTSLLVAGFTLFIVATADALTRAKSAHATVAGIRLAIAGLALTVLMGSGLASVWAGFLELPVFRPQLTDLHLTQALVSWVFLLIVSVSYQVVPMFFVTSAYPSWMTRGLAPVTFLFTLVNLVVTLASSGRITQGAYLLAFPVLLYCGVTLYLLRKRKRKLPDPSVRFWATGLGLAICAVGGWLFQAPGVGVGAVTFASVTAITSGMLLKIVPFLSWFHLRAASDGTRAVPNMKELVPEKWGRASFQLFAATLVGLPFPRLGAVVFLAFSAQMLAMIWRGARHLSQAVK